MTNQDWLHSLEPKELTEWFAAELVDTRAERTCHLEHVNGIDTCSECGADMDTPRNYCQHCGAEVVE